MRQPRNHAEVAHQWASREVESGHSGNMSFRHGVIYSYDWWDIAQNCETKEGKPYVIMTGYSYSNSTSKHIMHVRRAIPNHIPVYYSNERSSGYGGYRSYPVLTDEAVLRSMLKNIESNYNSFMTPKSHGGRSSTEDMAFGNHGIYRSAEDFAKMTGLKLNQDFDKYKVSDNEIRIMKILTAPYIERKERRIREAEEKEKLRNEAIARLILKYGKDSMQLAKDWIGNKLNLDRGGIRLPDNDPDAKMLGWMYLSQPVETAMRIEGDQIVTNHSARISLAAGKRLWGMMKANLPIIGEKVDMYTVVKNNGELVIGCHHIKREIVDYFVEYYNW